jgi:integrase/recombinase XerD
VITWRKEMEIRFLSPASIRRKLSALSSLFDYLCERNAVAGNPVDGVKRPMANNNEGSTPALGDAQARRLLDAPQKTRSRASGTGRSSPPCSTTAFAGRNCVS